MNLAYVAVIYKVNKRYDVVFPGFPGFIASGETITKAVECAKCKIITHIEEFFESDQPLPAPIAMEKIIAAGHKNSSQYKDDIYCFINIIQPTGNLKRINICMDSGLLSEIDRAAELCGKNRSEFLSDAARKFLI